MPFNPRRTKSGRFSKRGLYRAVKGKLVRIKPVAPPQARRPSAAPRRRARRKDSDIETIPPSVRVEAPSGRTGATFTTWFKAMGTTGALADLRSVESPDLLNEDLDEFNAPAAFYSNQSGILGQVRWGGIVSLDILIDRLNDALQFSGEGSESFDFRRAYPRWEYRYQVVEHLGAADRVIAFEKKRRNS